MTIIQKYSKESELSKEILNFNYDYNDSFIFTYKSVNCELDIFDFVEAFLKPGPKWFRSILKLRDILVSPFNLKKGSHLITKSEGITKQHLKIGARVGFFQIFDILDDEIVLGENDKHLDFRVVMKLDKDETQLNYSLSTLVKYNNNLGRVYFFFVKPFHILLVPFFVNRNLKNLSKM